jgi:CRP/FNR family cyclic AMP-dependent transcriptional regulator
MTEVSSYHTLKDLLNHPQFLEGEFWQRRHFQENDMVIVEGEVNKEIFVILSGQVFVCTDVKIADNNKMQSGLCELFDGEEFAHSCFFDDEPHSASVKTVKTSELAVIDAIKLKQFLDQYPKIGYQILNHWMELILPRVRQGNKRFVNLFSWGLKAHKIEHNIGMEIL